MSDKPTGPEPKKYGLTTDETRLMGFLRQTQDQTMSVIISYIASGRLGYKLTPQTQFNIDPEFKTITINELPQPGNDVASAQPETDTDKTSESPVKTAV